MKKGLRIERARLQTYTYVSIAQLTKWRKTSRIFRNNDRLIKILKLVMHTNMTIVIRKLRKLYDHCGPSKFQTDMFPSWSLAEKKYLNLYSSFDIVDPFLYLRRFYPNRVWRKPVFTGIAMLFEHSRKCILRVLPSSRTEWILNGMMGEWMDTESENLINFPMSE